MSCSGTKHKVGDKLICKNMLIEYEYGATTSRATPRCSAGKSVTIIEVSLRSLFIKNTEGDEMEIKFCDIDSLFYTKKEVRRMKLEEIDESRK